MTRKDHPAIPSANVGQALRQQAEALLHTAPSPEDETALSPEAARQILHDLRVHQMELEMQNEEMRRAHAELDTVRVRYFDLYDLAPISYCTLSESGLILEANLTAATLLGMTRSTLVKQRITRFIFKEDQDLYYQHHKQLVETGAPQSCELRMMTRDGAVFWTHLQTTSAQDESGAPVCRVVLNDITQRKQSEKQLLTHAQQYRDLIHYLHAGVVVHAPDTRIVLTNEQASRLLGLSMDQLLDKTAIDPAWVFVHEDQTPMPLAEYPVNRVLATRQPVRNLVLGINHPSTGNRVWVLVNAFPEPDAQGNLRHIVVTFIDITERKHAEEKLQLAASVFTHAREGILITTADGTILEVNNAFTQITGYSRDDVIGHNPRLFSSGLHDQAFFAALWRDLIEKGYWSGEIWNRRKNSEAYAELLTISAVRDAQGHTRQYVALFADITVLKAHEKELEHIAHYDVLTMLPNRVLLADRLQQAMAQTQRRGQPVAVVLLDLDGFKAINDRYGHDVGDQLLMIVATRMKQVLREGDTLARLGGDEFVAVLLDLVDIEASVPLLTRLLGAAAETAQIGHVALHVSASAGVTFYPQADEVDAEQLLRQADQAMYQAKQAGKNRYHLFDTVQDRSVRNHHENLERIHRALTAHEFVLYYQPKVNMRTGAVIGAEALIRWQHPEQGLLPPAAFLPLIEDHPLTVAIGEWVIETALLQMETWQAAGFTLPVSVNIGALQLQQQNFVERLHVLLAAHPRVKPASLQLEVLETSALEDLARVSQVIAACRKIGVRFALDDFGAGYSSLTYLKRLAVALLKIDQSFVRDMLDDPEDLAILEGVIGLATAFRRQVIAEGVETVGHGEMLLQFGCELAQGYGIARPMPAADLPGWVARWRPNPRWVNRSAVSRDDLPILFASVEHRAWVMAFEAFLQGAQDALPLDHHPCRFSAWLEAEDQAGHSGQPAFQFIAALHQQAHALAEELLELQVRGRNSDACARLGELHVLRDQLQEQLAGLLQERQS